MSWLRRHLVQFAKLYSQTLRPSSQPQQCTTAAHDITTFIDCEVEQFYKYTSGRWLWNEKNQFARRHVEFDLPGLVQVSAQAIGAHSCVKVEKLPEGNFSKVFLVVMDDGRELIAKLPNPNAGRPHLTTASEVATMDYVRNVLGIPAPRIFSWNSSTDNPARAEYILMERSEGVELGKMWHDMSWKDRLEVVRTLVGYERAFASADLPMYGSLYYAKDIPSPSAGQFLTSVNSVDKGDAFVVGPTTNRAFFDRGRDSVDVGRGPWPSLDQHIYSRAQRELACVEKYLSYPGQQGLFNGPNQYRPTKALKLEVLRDYMKVATQILPNDVKLSKPALWHSDLHANNIFVDPSQPTRILSVIDWQTVNISPLFLQARHPALIRYEGPIPMGLKPIKLPDDFDDMDKEAQHKAKDLRAAQSLYKLYEILMLQHCPEIAHALHYQETLPGRIIGLASSIFSDGEPVPKGMLIRLQDEWAKHVSSSSPCPMSFTPGDRTQQQRLETSWSQGVKLMDEIINEIGTYQGWDGWVNHNNYPVYKERLARCRENFLNRHAKTEGERRQWMQAWPFEEKTHTQTLL